MIVKIADNILSPLGSSTMENFRAVLKGESELRCHKEAFGLPEPFCGSLFDRKAIAALFEGDTTKYSFFEQLCILSIKSALTECNIDAESDDVIFVLSTTKGNVEKIADNPDDEDAYLSGSAGRIARWFGNKNEAIVVSNACISGVCAQIAAVRALLSGAYRCAVVVGCDVLSRFIVSGFQSFKALSPDPCKPYDKDRTGLNLGEAAGTLILKNENKPEPGMWRYLTSSIHNDANHISGPSRTGEGTFRVLSDILKEVSSSELAFINAHGTATAYNDEMEAIAIHRAGLENVPVNGLKGYFGHTLGAAGIIETILSMAAIDNGVMLPTRGYTETGTTKPLDVCRYSCPISKSTFIKILSGFGGSNAGISYGKGGDL